MKYINLHRIIFILGFNILTQIGQLQAQTRNQPQESKQMYSYTPDGKEYYELSKQKIVVKFNTNIRISERADIVKKYPLLKTISSDMLVPSQNIGLLELDENNMDDTKLKELLEQLQQEENIVYANPFLIYRDGMLQGITEKFYVKLKSMNDYNLLEQEAKNNLIKMSHVYEYDSLLYFLEVDKNSKGNALEIANRLSETKKFICAEPDFLLLTKPCIPADPGFQYQWALNNTGSSIQYNGTLGADMMLLDAWNIAKGNNIKVAVIDEGVDTLHSDLVANLLPGFDATSSGLGVFPLVHDAHGTACAGIIAADSNGLGLVGVAYNALIVPVKIAFSAGSTWFTNYSWMANGIDWAWDQGDADVLSNSWKAGSSSTLINDAIDRATTLGRGGKGAPVFFSSGNYNSDVSYPASHPNVIAVGASTMCDQRKRSGSQVQCCFYTPNCTGCTYSGCLSQYVSFDSMGVSCDEELNWGSNYGQNLDIVAPGVKILTCDISGIFGYTTSGVNQDYTFEFNGTSAACPNAAGIMALILSADTNLNLTQAREILELSCEKVGGVAYTANVTNQPNGTWNNEMGYGRVNAFAALQLVKNLPCSVTITASNNIATNCLNQNITFTATPTSGGANPTYQWLVNGMNVGYYTATFTSLSLNKDDIVTCIMTTSLPGISGTTVISNAITVAGLPIPILSPYANPSSICMGKSGQLIANAGTILAPVVNYSWSPSINMNNPSSENPIVSPSSNTIYTITVTDANGCTANATTVVLVSSIPSLSALGNVTATPTTICLGEIIDIQHTLFVPQCATQNGFENAFTPISSFYGMSGSMYGGNINVSSTPNSIVFGNSNGSIDGYYSLPIHCDGVVTFDWTVTTTSPNVYVSPIYYLIGGYSPNYLTGFLPMPIPGTQSGTETITVYAGTILTLASNTSANISNISGPFMDVFTVDWYDAAVGGNLIGSIPYGLYNLNPPNYILHKPDVSGSYTYYAELVSPYTGCSSNRVASNTVMVNPTPTINTSATPSVLCEGDSCQLNAVVSIVVPIINYTWSPNYALTHSNIINPKAAPPLPTVYQLTVTDANGCTQSNTQNVYVKSLPIVSTAAALTSTLCKGEPTTLSYTAPTPALQCIGNHQTIGFKGIYNEAHWTKVSANTYNSVVIAGYDSSSLQFTLPTSIYGLFGSGYSNYSITIPCNGIVSFKWVYNFGTANVEFPRYAIDGGPFIIFPGFDTTIDTITNNYNFYQTGTFNIAVSAGQTFTLQAYTSDNYHGGFTLDIDSFKAPVQTFTTQTVTWFDAPNGGTNIGFGNSLIYSPPSAGTFTYYAQVSNGFAGCTNPNRVTTNSVQINPIPEISVSASLDSICAGTATTITASNALTYSWSPGGLSGSTHTVSPSSTTTYTVTGTNIFGCTKTSSIQITVTACGSSSNFYVSALGSYTWVLNGATYTQSGSYTYTSLHVGGGTDTSILILTITYLEIMIDQSISCYGANDGSCQANVIAPASFNLYTLDNTLSNSTGYFQGLTPGTHTICASNGSITECATFTMIEPTALSITLTTVAPISCQGGDGSLLGVVSGGTLPYDVSWINASNVLLNYGNQVTNLNPGIYTFNVLDNNGCYANASILLDTPNVACGSVLNLKLFIEGYYTGGGFMEAAMLNQGVLGATSIMTDTIIVELRNTIPPYAIAATLKTILHTNGEAVCNFPIQGNFYVAIKHRNGLQTWSANTISLGNIPISYNFSDAINKAYGGNLATAEGNVFALYSGDLVVDENMDLLDLSALEDDINNFLFGYYASDINGDGNIDLLDTPPVEANSSGFIFSNHP